MTLIAATKTHDLQYIGRSTERTWSCSCGWTQTWTDYPPQSPFGYKEAQAVHPRGEWDDFILLAKIKT